MRVSVVGSLLFSRFTAYLSPFSLVSFCNTEVSEFLDMENSEQLFVARVPKILRNYCRPVKRRNAIFSVLNPL